MVETNALILEYALNAVNQGVTALGIKGKLAGNFEEATPILMRYSDQRHCSRHRKEVIIPSH